MSIEERAASFTGLEGRISWDSYFMVIARAAALRSTCMNRNVGAAIVKDKQILSTGYNGALSGQKHCIDLGYCIRRKENFTATDKHWGCVANHAETNAIDLAAKKGIALEGSTLYATLIPCPSCMKSVIPAGITEVVYNALVEDKPAIQLTMKYAKDSSVNMRLYEISPEDQNRIRKFLAIKDISKRKLKPTK